MARMIDHRCQLKGAVAPVYLCHTLLHGSGAASVARPVLVGAERNCKKKFVCAICMFAGLGGRTSIAADRAVSKTA